MPSCGPYSLLAGDMAAMQVVDVPFLRGLLGLGSLVVNLTVLGLGFLGCGLPATSLGGRGFFLFFLVLDGSLLGPGLLRCLGLLLAVIRVLGSFLALTVDASLLCRGSTLVIFLGLLLGWAPAFLRGGSRSRNIFILNLELGLAAAFLWGWCWHIFLLILLLLNLGGSLLLGFLLLRLIVILALLSLFALGLLDTETVELGILPWSVEILDMSKVLTRVQSSSGMWPFSRAYLTFSWNSSGSSS